MLHYYIVAILLISLPCFGLQDPTDSAASVAKQKNFTTTLTVRSHSMGFFSFMGRLATDNPAVDFYFNYTHKSNWGFQVFKAVDIYDRHSPNNFALGVIFHHFNVHPKLTITPYAGVVLDQAHSLADRGSDISSMVSSVYKFSPHFAIEHLALFPNLVLERGHADWVNRFRFMYTYQHLDVTGWTWLNNRVFDENTYQSAGLSVYYSRIPVAGKLKLSTGITGLVMLQTSNANSCPKKNGLLLTVAATWH